MTRFALALAAALGLSLISVGNAQADDHHDHGRHGGWDHHDWDHHDWDHHDWDHHDRDWAYRRSYYGPSLRFGYVAPAPVYVAPRPYYVAPAPYYSGYEPTYGYESSGFSIQTPRFGFSFSR